MTTETRTWRAAFLEEPARLAAAQPAQLGISALSMLFTAIFFAAPLLAVAWLPQALIFLVTGMAALGVEYAFLKGVSDRAFVEARGGRGVWGDILVYTTGALLVVAGCTVLLTYAYKLPEMVTPAPWGAALLSLLHIVPLACIGVCSAQLHAAAEKATQQQALRGTRHAEERREEIDLKVYEAEQAAMARVRVRAAQTRTEAPAHEAHAAAPSPVRAMTRDELCAAVRAARADDPAFSRADLARRAGWSEAMVRKLVKELETPQ